MSKHRLFNLFKKRQKGEPSSSEASNQSNGFPSVFKQGLFSNEDLAKQSRLPDEYEVLPDDLNPVSFQPEVPTLPMAEVSELTPSPVVVFHSTEEMDLGVETDEDYEDYEDYEPYIPTYEEHFVKTNEPIMVTPFAEPNHQWTEVNSGVEPISIQTTDIPPLTESTPLVEMHPTSVIPTVAGKPTPQLKHSNVETIVESTPVVEPTPMAPVVAEEPQKPSVKPLVLKPSKLPDTKSIPEPSIRFVKKPLFDAVKRIPIIEVARLYQFDLQEWGENKYIIRCLNPEHDEDGSTKFTFDLETNIAGCYRCGFYYPNSVLFLKAILKEDEDWKIALELGYQFELITEDIYHSALQGGPVLPEHISTDVTFEPVKTVERVKTPINPVNLDRIYRCLMLTYRVNGSNRSEEHPLLSKDDFKYLHSTRRMSLESIKKGEFFTFPKSFQFLTFVEILLHNKIIQSTSELDGVLKGIPGFYYDEKKSTWTFRDVGGIAIPIKNADGLIVALQTRNSDTELQRLSNKNPNKKPSRYGWFSSKNSEKEGHTHATSSGTPVAIIKPDVIKKTTVFITEGVFKAQKIAETFGCIAISVQGVNTYKGIVDELRKLLEQGHPITHLYLAYDADASYKSTVFTASVDTMALLAEQFPSLQLRYVGWDVYLGKGIDDLIEAGHKERLDTLPREIFENLCGSFTEVLKQHNKDWTEDHYIKFYNENILCHFPKYRVA